VCFGTGSLTPGRSLHGSGLDLAATSRWPASSCVLPDRLASPGGLGQAWSQLVDYLLVERRLYTGDFTSEIPRKFQGSTLRAVRVPAAWAKARSIPSQKKVTVALVDSGIQAGHEDLKSNIVTGYNVMDKNADTQDTTGHGTAMAGVVGAVTNNDKGISGVADHIKLMPIRVYGTIAFRHFSDAINYAVDSKVDLIILSASWKPKNAAVEASITKATQANIPLICASGNRGKNVSLPGETSYPCEYSKTLDGIICVSGTDNAGMNLHSKSNYAPFVDVAAPANVYSTTLSGGYDSFAGTSGSAAIVAGVIAMMKSVAPRPLSVKEIKSIIISTSTPGVKSFDGKAPMPFGRLDALRTMEKVIR
ncbi:hypothetical protein FOL47_011384, partial [Perkinsus chesapeaki]